MMENDDKFDKTIDHDDNGGGTPEASDAGASWVRRGLVAALAVAAVAGVGVTLAQGSGWGGGQWGPGGHHGWGRGGPGFGEGRIERMLDGVDATADQEKKVWAAIDGARGEIRPIMREFRGTREQLATLLSAPTIDRAAVEKLRAERVAAIDDASKKVTDALVNAAETLTPEQRAKLAEQLKQRPGRW
jgi:Spy/CpxP family protein refolding chaperone